MIHTLSVLMIPSLPLIKALLSGVSAFLIAITLTPIIRKIAIKTNNLDVPCERKVHTQSTPRLGGIAIYVSFIICILTFSKLTPVSLGLLLGASFLVIIGILDDIFSIPPSIKLLSQIFAALVALDSGIVITTVVNPFGQALHLGGFSVPFTIFWIVAMINVMNLIDGLDGLAGSIAAISAIVLVIVAFTNNQSLAMFLGVTLLGSTLGFLKHNLFPAKIFMGDTGSMLLGYLLATISIIGVLKTTITLSLFIPILVLGIPITDTFYAIYRRVKRKQHIFSADREHIHHQLLDWGLSQKQVTGICAVWTMLLGCGAIIISQLSGSMYMMAAVLTLLGIVTLFLLTKALRYTTLKKQTQSQQPK